MSNSKKEDSFTLSFSDLDWEKGNEYVDRYVEVIKANASPRTVVLDFGSFDDEGTRDNKLVNPRINLHTRIRMSPNHFASMVEVLNRILRDISEEEKEE